MSLIRATFKSSLRLNPSQRQSANRNHGLFLSKGERFVSILAGLDLDHRSTGQFTFRSNPLPSTSKHAQNHDLQQTRFRRHDRASAFTKPRPRTRKQRQAYNRKIKKLTDEAERHSAPGSKAGPRRQWIRERKQQLLEAGTETELVDLDSELEYGYEDALIEDIMGNTSHLTSQPTPEPVHLGNMYPKFYNKVAGQMEKYRQAIDDARSKNEHEIVDIATMSTLPSDNAISDLLRSYRDLNGTRNKPIGIVMALQHLLSDIGVPTSAFGEYSYTSLLTCCRTPKEARRIFKLMRDNRHPISAYSWSILVDIYGKLGDFEGCAQVIEEMASEGVAPTQAAYTSLLAACYKICNDGRIPHSIRAKAGKLGWAHWQQMRIVGIEADAMAFGAIIRLCAARGQPERAINLLEEMNRFDVKPTTLCFSSALRAVARSHEIGTRFEHGWSQKQLRRESFTAHHGKMAREIVIMAENAEVKLDDGFVSALMLCAAAAGDSATAKAVFLASEVRKMDHLRTIGGESHLRQLRGGGEPDQGSFQQVEDTNNLGYLNAGDSLQESDGAIMTIDSQLSGSEIQASKSFGEREYGKDTRSISALLQSCAKALNNNGLGTMWAGKTNQGYLCENSLRLITTRWEPSYRDTSIPGESSTKLGISALQRYDQHDREDQSKKGVRKKFRGLYVDDDALLTIDDIDQSIPQENEGGDELFNSDIGSPFTMNNLEQEDLPQDRDDGSEILANGFVGSSEKLTPSAAETFDSKDKSLDEREVFETFYEELKEEALKNGEDFDLSKEDAEEFFKMMHEEFAEALESDSAEDWNDTEGEDFLSSVNDVENEDSSPLESIERFGVDEGFFAGLEKSPNENGDDIDSNLLFQEESENNKLEARTIETVSDPESPNVLTTADAANEEEIEQLKDLQEALPGMPLSRLKKVLKSFKSTLGYPSLITLVPILREAMPDTLTTGWLKQINTKTADFAFQKAEEDGMVNTALLNSMLQVKTSSASLDDALSFHSTQYKKHKAKPTGYSDRLVVQMLVDNKRMTRALQLKQTIEEEGRTLDIPSYGSIIEYYSKHGQLGSAMMFVEECIRQHGAAPSEKYLTKLRVLSRQTDLEKDLLITDLIGQDPIQWLKHGEAHLKREMSRKGRRNVKMAYNRAIQA